MQYITVKQAAKRWKISDQRVHVLCTLGRIDGVIKEGHSYRIPESALKPVDDENFLDKNASEQYSNLFSSNGEMKINNSINRIDSIFSGNGFSMQRWIEYIESVIPNSYGLFLDDIKEYDFTSTCLPVIQDVIKKEDKLEQTIKSFDLVTHGLEEKIKGTFGRSLDVEVILYLGLCNGAGWVTTINGQTKILLGIEKIIELNWCDVNSMYGLIYHELGHVYQEKNGILRRTFDDTEDKLLWQLFTEGIAMYFEQKLVGDFEYYHQDKNGWKNYLDLNLNMLKKDFDRDIKNKEKKQRYFGDWTNYHNYGDTGYYLGAKFVQHIVHNCEFDSILDYDIDHVKSCYNVFMEVCQEK